jgi:hypothetical protein
MLIEGTHRQTETSHHYSSYFKNLVIKKRKLVKLELDLIAQVQVEWQNLLENTTTNQTKAEHSIKACYDYLGMDAPNLIWLDSPIAATKVLINSPDLQDISGLIMNGIWQSEVEIQRSIDAKYILQVLKNVNPQQSIETQLGTKAVESIAARSNELITRQVKDLVADQIGFKLPDLVQDYNIGYLSYFDYFHRIGMNIPQVQFAIDLAKSCGWCWTFEKIVMLTPKPSPLNIYSEIGL